MYIIISFYYIVSNRLRDPFRRSKVVVYVVDLSAACAAVVGSLEKQQQLLLHRCPPLWLGAEENPWKAVSPHSLLGLACIYIYNHV